MMWSFPILTEPAEPWLEANWNAFATIPLHRQFPIGIADLHTSIPLQHDENYRCCQMVWSAERVWVCSPIFFGVLVNRGGVRAPNWNQKRGISNFGEWPPMELQFRKWFPWKKFYTTLCTSTQTIVRDSNKDSLFPEEKNVINHGETLQLLYRSNATFHVEEF